VNKIQEKVKNAYLDVPQKKQASNLESTDASNGDATATMLLQEVKNFNLLFSTIVWFLEHDPFMNTAMNLDVNCWIVKQENFTTSKGTDKCIYNAITVEKGDTFQNTPIHLFFYEKRYKSDLPKDDQGATLENNPPEVFSLSSCKLKTIKPKLDNWAYRLNLQLVSRDYTAGFVSHEQYEQLLFVLGQNSHNAPGRSCKEVLTLFNDFPTNTPYNFKDMLHRLEIPFVYDKNKTLAQNRRDFQDFFSCLTNIRCAVVEGGHCCEAASWTL